MKAYTKLEKAIIKFGDTEIEKHKFHKYQRSISIKDIGFKYFIGSKDAKKIRPFSIFLPKMSSYKGDFDETNYVFFDKTWLVIRKI